MHANQGAPFHITTAQGTTGNLFASMASPFYLLYNRHHPFCSRIHSQLHVKLLPPLLLSLPKTSIIRRLFSPNNHPTTPTANHA